MYLADNPDAELPDSELTEVEIESSPGDFDLRGFEIARSEFFDFAKRPIVTFENKKMKFSAECVHRFGERNSIEILINPITRKIAIRPTEKTNRNAVVFSTLSNKVYHPRLIPTAAFSDTLFSLFGWNKDYKYRIIGSIIDEFLNNDVATEWLHNIIEA